MLTYYLLSFFYNIIFITHAIGSYNINYDNNILVFNDVDPKYTINMSSEGIYIISIIDLEDKNVAEDSTVQSNQQDDSAQDNETELIDEGIDKDKSIVTASKPKIKEIDVMQFNKDMRNFLFFNSFSNIGRRYYLSIDSNWTLSSRYVDGKLIIDFVKKNINRLLTDVKNLNAKKVKKENKSILNINLKDMATYERAIFWKSGWLWLAIKKSDPKNTQAVNLAKQILIRSAGLVLTTENVVNDAKYIVIRMVLDPNYTADFELADEDLIMNFFVKRNYTNYRTNRKVAVYLQNNEKINNHILLLTQDNNAYLKVVDPSLGRSFAIFMVNYLNTYVEQEYDYSGIKLIKTINGIVVLDNESIKYNYKNSYIEIYSEDEMINFSQYSAEQQIDENKLLNYVSQAFLFNQTMISFGDLFFFKKQYHMYNIINSVNEEAKHSGRLILARFFLVNGMINETVSVLDNIDRRYLLSKTRDINNFYNLYGLIYYLSERYNTALSLFSKQLKKISDKKSKAEIKFFIRLIRLLKYKNKNDLKYVLKNLIIIRPYPVWLKSKITFQIADAAIEKNNTDGIFQLINSINFLSSNLLYKDALIYRKAMLYYKKQDYDKQNSYFAKLFDSSKNYYSTMAKYYYYTSLYDRGKLSDKDYISELESIRYNWRDSGQFEYNIVSKLSDLYLNLGYYKRSMNLRHKLILKLDDDILINKATSTIKNHFTDIMTNNNYNLSDFELLILYNDFNELLPVGNKGDLIVNRVIDAMINLDLLDKASDLLQRYVEYRFNGVNKINNSIKLSLVYLLNKQPRKAFLALLKIDNSAPKVMQEQKRYLLAFSLMRLKYYNYAIAVLSDDRAYEANLLRADIYWRSGQWNQYILSVKEILPNNVLTIKTERQIKIIFNMLIAAQLDQDVNLVNDLYNKYYVAIEKTIYKDAFDIIFDQKQVDVNKLDEYVKSANKFSLFMSKYLSQLEFIKNKDIVLN